MNTNNLEFQMLQKIRLRPAMYTGEETLGSIITYISGYRCALYDCGVFDHKAQNDLKHPSFTDFVAQKLGFSSSTAGVTNMILATCCGENPKTIYWDLFLQETKTQEQHKKSIHLFYSLLDEYTQTYESFIFL